MNSAFLSEVLEIVKFGCASCDPENFLVQLAILPSLELGLNDDLLRLAAVVEEVRSVAQVYKHHVPPVVSDNGVVGEEECGLVQEEGREVEGEPMSFEEGERRWGVVQLAWDGTSLH